MLFAAPEATFCDGVGQHAAADSNAHSMQPCETPHKRCNHVLIFNSIAEYHAAIQHCARRTCVSQPKTKSTGSPPSGNARASCTTQPLLLLCSA